jgi:hypothetical protein
VSPNWWTNCTKEQPPEKWTGNRRNDIKDRGRNLKLELERGIIEYVESILSIAINYTRYTTQNILLDNDRTIAILLELQQLVPVDLGSDHIYVPTKCARLPRNKSVMGSISHFILSLRKRILVLQRTSSDFKRGPVYGIECNLPLIIRRVKLSQLVLHISMTFMTYDSINRGVKRTKSCRISVNRCAIDTCHGEVRITRRSLQVCWTDVETGIKSDEIRP